jgi:1-phosphofructokinase family hexose kinase
MVITVTLNTAIDHVIHIANFEPGETIRASRSYLSIGGKGTDASYVLGTLGIVNLAMGFKAGVFGQKMEALLHERGVSTEFIAVGGETRISTVVITNNAPQTTLTVDTLRITEHHIDELMRRYHSQLDQAGCVVIGGTPPIDFPTEKLSDLLKLAQTQGIPTVVDASGPALQAAIECRPTFVKPNLTELRDLIGTEVETLGEVARAGDHLLNQYGAASVITLGAQGAIAIWPGGRLRIHPLKARIVNTAGAGDAVLAGIAHALDSGLTIDEGLRIGFGAAAAVMGTPRTADCNPDEAERLMQQVRITHL